jgi:hypothetical protein
MEQKHFFHETLCPLLAERLAENLWFPSLFCHKAICHFLEHNRQSDIGRALGIHGFQHLKVKIYANYQHSAEIWEKQKTKLAKQTLNVKAVSPVPCSFVLYKHEPQNKNAV